MDTVTDILRYVVIVGGFAVMLFGLIRLPRLHPLSEFFMTTGLLALVASVSFNEISDLGKPIDFSLVSSLCGIILTGIGLTMIRR